MKFVYAGKGSFVQKSVINLKTFVQFDVKIKEIFVGFNTNKYHTMDIGYWEGVCLCTEK